MVLVTTVILVYYAILVMKNLRDLPPGKAENSLRTVAFCGWFCFLIAEAYFEGALTMFFTTEKDLPFTSIEVKCFPTLHLMHISRDCTVL